MQNWGIHSTNLVFDFDKFLFRATPHQCLVFHRPISANTKDYTLTTKYTDGHTSQIKIKINATLATSEVE